MEPADTTTVLHIEILEDNLEPGLYFLHVFGKEPGDENTYYGLICCHWEEWLGMEIAPDTLTRFTPFEIVAGCLYEMTWAGFDQKKTDAFRKKYFDTVAPDETHEEDWYRTSNIVWINWDALIASGEAPSRSFCGKDGAVGRSGCEGASPLAEAIRQMFLR